jgi:hypothetical protein
VTPQAITGAFDLHDNGGMEFSNLDLLSILG